MIKTTAIILQELAAYASPADKLSRLVRQGVYTPIVKGLYETNPATNGYLLAASIYGPSYLSFEFALSMHGFIPEGVRSFTCATFDKKKKKNYHTSFGSFLYQDIPCAAFPHGVTLVQEGDYVYALATPEKALCDQLCKLPPVRNYKEFSALLFDDLRIDPAAFKTLNATEITLLAPLYARTNIYKLNGFLKRYQNGHHYATDDF